MVLPAEQRLSQVPLGSNVAVVTLRGSLCPITRAHVRGFVEARQLLLRQSEHPVPARLEAFAECLGFISLNGDRHVWAKMREVGHRSLDVPSRQHLVELAVQDYDWMGAESSWEGASCVELAKRWPGLNFVHFRMNGADDVISQGKWSWAGPNCRLITLGRPGFTEEVRKGMVEHKIESDDPYFVLGPELPDISSTAVRKAIIQDDLAVLESLLDPKVAQWCIESHALSIPTDQRLRRVPGGSNVAVVTLRGSLCPITRAHLQGFVAARALLLRQSEQPLPALMEEFAECLGFICLNGDRHVWEKMNEAGQSSLDFETRQHLVELAVQDYDWMGLEPDRKEGTSVVELAKRWPELNFVHFHMNGADDVVAYGKYKWSGPDYRLLTMGRPGFTEEVRKGMAEHKIEPDSAFFVLGPELPDISSTSVRKAIAKGDLADLEALLDSKVARWCIENQAFASKKRKLA